MPEACLLYVLLLRWNDLCLQRHAFVRWGALQKAQCSVIRYSGGWIQLFCGVFEEQKAMPKLHGKLRTLSTALQQWRHLIPLLLSPLPPSEVLGWCPFPYPVIPCPASYLTCLPGLIFTTGSRNPSLCLVAKPLGSSVCKQCLKKKLGLGRQVAFLVLRNPLWIQSRYPRKQFLLSKLKAKVMCSTGLNLSTGFYLICKLFLALLSKVLASIYKHLMPFITLSMLVRVAWVTWLSAWRVSKAGNVTQKLLHVSEIKHGIIES